jgi:galactose dehydrogenase
MTGGTMSASAVQYSDLKGKSVLITGGASGIGAALVAGFLKQGSQVSFIDIDQAAAMTLKEALDSRHANNLHFFKADLADVPATQNAVSAAVAAMGGLDVLINNAARDDRHDFATVSEADWENSQAVNLKQIFFVCQAALAPLRQAGGGSIINFSSIAFLLNMPELPIYATAKAGIIGLTKSLAAYAGPDKIRVNAILPGMIVTERQKKLWLTETSIAAFVERQCLKRALVADDLVGPCLFLASESSGAITAQTLIVDGGAL